MKLAIKNIYWRDVKKVFVKLSILDKEWFFFGVNNARERALIFVLKNRLPKAMIGYLPYQKADPGEIGFFEYVG